MKVVLISCVKTKKAGKHKAKDLYDGTWFRYAFRYAQSLRPNKVFILSAKYHLVDQNKEIKKYEKMLKSMSARDTRAWADKVLTDLSQQTDLEKDIFIILAGEKYRKYLVCHLANCDVPMEGLSRGEQLHWLKERCCR